MILPMWVKPALLGVALLGSAYGGYHYRDLSAQRDTLKFQVAAQEAAKNYTDQLVNISKMVEEEFYASEKKHSAELDYYRNLIKQSGGLFDNGATSGEATSSPGGSATVTGGVRLSDTSADFLLDQANKADQVVDQLLLCQKFIKEVWGVK